MQLKMVSGRMESAMTEEVLGLVFVGTLFVAIIAALQSTIDSGINSTSLMITRDILHALLKDGSIENDLKRWWATALIAIQLAIYWLFN